MAGKWYKIGKGLQARDHESRKYGKRFDRYIRGRYMVDGKFRIIPFGWESDFAKAEKSRIESGVGGVARRALLEYATGELERLRANAKAGAGPATIKEERALAVLRQKEEEQAMADEENQSMTFREYFEKSYHPAAAVSKKHSTCKQEQSHYKVWLKPYIGMLRLIDIRPLHMEKVKRAMLKKKKAPRTIQAVLSLAMRTWNHSRNNGVVSGDWPGRSVKVGRFDNRRMRFLTHDECEALISKLKESSPQVGDMALLSLDSGLRGGEIFGLTWENVNIDAGQIQVVDTKSGKNRTAYMTTRVKTMFEGLPGGQGLVFPSNTGGRIGQISSTAKRVITEIGLNAGVSDSRNKATFHSLRHTFASRLVENGVDLYTVKELLGHGTLSMTERYSHLRPDTLQAAVKTLEQKPMADVIRLQATGK